MLSGLLMVLLRALWIWVKVGLSVLSFCQQSSMSWCRDGGQFTGAGNRNPSSIAFITCNVNIHTFKHKNIIIEYWLFGVMEYIDYWPIKKNAESYIVTFIYFKNFSLFPVLKQILSVNFLDLIVYTSHWCIFNEFFQEAFFVLSKQSTLIMTFLRQVSKLNYFSRYFKMCLWLAFLYDLLFLLDNPKFNI